MRIEIKNERPVCDNDTNEIIRAIRKLAVQNSAGKLHQIHMILHDELMQLNEGGLN